MNPPDLSDTAERVLKVLKQRRRLSMDDVYAGVFGQQQQAPELRSQLIVALASLRALGLVGLTVHEDGTTMAWLQPDKTNPHDVADFLRG